MRDDGEERTQPNAVTAAAVAAAVELVKRDFRLDVIEKRLAEIEDWQTRADVKLDEIATAANRWKGGFLVIVALGALIGWIVSFASGVGKFIK